jgi:hypothetical protein
VNPAAGRAGPGDDRRGRDVPILVGCTLLRGLIFGALPVGVAAVTAAARLPGLAGVLQAAITAGGLIGTFGLAVTASRAGYVRVSGVFAVALAPAAVLAAAPSAPVLAALGASLAVASRTAGRRGGPGCRTGDRARRGRAVGSAGGPSSTEEISNGYTADLG